MKPRQTGQYRNSPKKKEKPRKQILETGPVRRLGQTIMTSLLYYITICTSVLNKMIFKFINYTHTFILCTYNIQFKQSIRRSNKSQ